MDLLNLIIMMILMMTSIFDEILFIYWIWNEVLEDNCVVNMKLFALNI